MHGSISNHCNISVEISDVYSMSEIKSIMIAD